MSIQDFSIKNLSDVEQRRAARQFINNWAGRSYEKGESSTFWPDLLSNVFGVINVGNYIKFEEHCTTPYLKEDEIQTLFIKGVNMLVKDKQEIIAPHKEMVKTVFDTSSLENEQVKKEVKASIVDTVSA